MLLHLLACTLHTQTYKHIHVSVCIYMLHPKYISNYVCTYIDTLDTYKHYALSLP